VLIDIEPRGYLVEFASGLRMGLIGDLWDVEPDEEPIRTEGQELK